MFNLCTCIASLTFHHIFVSFCDEFVTLKSSTLDVINVYLMNYSYYSLNNTSLCLVLNTE